MPEGRIAPRFAAKPFSDSARIHVREILGPDAL